MDPLSITTGCLALLSAVAKTTLGITKFVRGCREARADLAAVNLELSGLTFLLELLKDDSAVGDESSVTIPESLQTQIQSIIANCTAVVAKINSVLDNCNQSKTGPSLKWLATGKAEVAGLRMSLEAHRASLNLALELMTISISIAVKEDTTAIRTDVVEIKQDTSHIPQIMEELEQLRAIVANAPGLAGSTGHNYILQQYLDGLTSYAETVRYEEGIESDRGSLHSSSRRSTFEAERAVAKRPAVVSNPSAAASEVQENLRPRSPDGNPNETRAATNGLNPPRDRGVETQATVDIGAESSTIHSDTIEKDESPALPQKDVSAGTAASSIDSSKSAQTQTIPFRELRFPFQAESSDDEATSEDITNNEDQVGPPATSSPAFPLVWAPKPHERELPVRRKLVIVGDGAIGKSSLLRLSYKGTFSKVYIPTVFENYIVHAGFRGINVELSMFDTGGAEDYDRLRPLSYPDCHVVLVCFAIDSTDSLDNVLEKWAPEVSHFCSSIPILLVGLKKDLRHDSKSIEELRSTGERVVSPEEGEKARQQIGAERYLECSAKTGDGVLEVLNCAAQLSFEKKRPRPNVPGGRYSSFRKLLSLRPK